MLVGLIRLTHLARMLGVDPDTAASWLARINYLPVQRPTIGLPDSGTRSPRYVSIEAAVRLCDLLLPVVVDRAANARAKRQARLAARALEQRTRNIRHLGGTGLDTPPPNRAL